MCVKNLLKVALDSATAGIEPATSSRKTNALTTAPPSHTWSGDRHHIHHVPLKIYFSLNLQVKNSPLIYSPEKAGLVYSIRLRWLYKASEVL